MPLLQIKAQRPLETSETTNPLTQHHTAEHWNPQSNICQNSNLKQQNMRGEKQNTNKGSSLQAPRKKNRLKNLKQMYLLTDSDLCSFPILKKKTFKPVRHSVQ
jgi:hypothetical protein